MADFKWEEDGRSNFLYKENGKTKAQLTMMEDDEWVLFVFGVKHVSWYATIAGTKGITKAHEAKRITEQVMKNISNDVEVNKLVVNRKRGGVLK